jgi:hypothetical protein
MGNFCTTALFPFALSVWKIPVAGGEETKVLDSVEQSGCTVTQAGIYFRTVQDASELCLYEFATGKVKKIMKMESGSLGGMAVSPDARTILYPRSERSSSDLMLVENFR